MSKGKLLGDCKTCGSEIVELANDGVFREGDCEACEYQRYKTQPDLLTALEVAANALKQQLLYETPGSGEYQDQSWVLETIHATLNKAYGKAT